MHVAVAGGRHCRRCGRRRSRCRCRRHHRRRLRPSQSLPRCGIGLTSVAGGLQGVLSSALQSEDFLSFGGGAVELCNSAAARMALDHADIGARVEALDPWRRSLLNLRQSSANLL